LLAYIPGIVLHPRSPALVHHIGYHEKHFIAPLVPVHDATSFGAAQSSIHAGALQVGVAQSHHPVLPSLQSHHAQEAQFSGSSKWYIHEHFVHITFFGALHVIIFHP
jgi:hypothetical protein